MGYQLRNYRHRNPKGKEDNSKSAPFFQPVQRKEPPGVQRLATSKEDEKLGTNDARMEKDKEEPMKPVQKKEAPDKQKGGKGDAEEKKKKPGGKQTGAAQKGGPKKEKAGKKGKEPEKDKKEKSVQKKAEKKEKKAPDKHEAVAAGIKDQSGKGSPLPRKILAEMNKSFGVDFSNVRIHHDAAAATLCRELNAMAFTHGQDIFFNEGKFNPETKEGKLLLAHELTHVVQQANSTPS